jgi:DNA-binding NtrC family response regulator
LAANHQRCPVIAATARDLERQDAGGFREDLACRLDRPR